jgi:hypothetical protein
VENQDLVWTSCMACSLTKFIWIFLVYCEKEKESEDEACVARREARLAHRIILDLVVDV